MIDVLMYEKMREDAHNFYLSIGSVRCPALDRELVHFTSEGFNHLIYKGNRSERPKENQMMRFKILSKAKEIIDIATTYQEYDEGLITLSKKKFKRIIQETTTVRYWGLVAII